jgi:hypothetical protein
LPKKRKKTKKKTETIIFYWPAIRAPGRLKMLHSHLGVEYGGACSALKCKKMGMLGFWGFEQQMQENGHVRF